MDVDTHIDSTFPTTIDEDILPGLERIRLMLVDDHVSVMEGYAALISRQPELELVGMFSNATTALASAGALRPDVVLMDIQMPGPSGLDATRQLLAQNPNCRVIILSHSGDPAAIATAFSAGAQGYLLKGTTFKQIVSAIDNVVQGITVIDSALQGTVIQELHRLREATMLSQHGLTAQEQRILGYMVEGHSNKQIAAILNKADKTIINQITVIYQKLGVANRAEAVSCALRLGIIQN